MDESTKVPEERDRLEKTVDTAVGAALRDVRRELAALEKRMEREFEAEVSLRRELAEIREQFARAGAGLEEVVRRIEDFATTGFGRCEVRGEKIGRLERDVSTVRSEVGGVDERLDRLERRMVVYASVAGVLVFLLRHMRTIVAFFGPHGG